MDGIENCFNSVTGYPATQPAMSADKWRSCWQLLIGFTIHTFGFTIDQAGVGTNINTFCVDDKEIYELSFIHAQEMQYKTEWQWSKSNRRGVKIHSDTRIGRQNIWYKDRSQSNDILNADLEGDGGGGWLWSWIQDWDRPRWVFSNLPLVNCCLLTRLQTDIRSE